MKRLLASILSITLALACASPVFAQYEPATAGLRLPSTAYANLPAASSANERMVVYVPDTPRGPSLLMSDGSSWQMFLNTGVAGLVNSVNSVSPATSGNVALNIASVGNVSGLVYLHRYSGVTLTVPALAAGSVSQGTATIPGVAVGDQCYVAPLTTSPLGYLLGGGSVSVAGTVKVQLINPAIIGVSATSITVNMFCIQ